MGVRGLLDSGGFVNTLDKTIFMDNITVIEFMTGGGDVKEIDIAVKANIGFTVYV